MLLELVEHFLKEIRIMSQAVTDLTNAVIANTAAVNAALAVIQSPTSVDPTDAPAIAAAVQQINANTDAITAALGGMTNVPPTPTAPTGLTPEQRQAALNAK
jgi:hypothetical protein